MFVRVSTEESESPEHKKELHGVFAAIRNNHPELLKEMRPTEEGVSIFLERRNIKLPPGLSTSHVPLLRLTGPIAKNAVQEFARKLFFALHYRETGRIIPREGGIRFWWWSNLQVIEGKVPLEVLQYARRSRPFRRGKVLINDQFSYRFDVSDDGELGLYIAKFNQAFVMLGIAVVNKASLANYDFGFEKFLGPLTCGESSASLTAG